MVHLRKANNKTDNSVFRENENAERKNTLIGDVTFPSYYDPLKQQRNALIKTFMLCRNPCLLNFFY